jgi:hypothetical protein
MSAMKIFAIRVSSYLFLAFADYAHRASLPCLDLLILPVLRPMVRRARAALVGVGGMG